MGAQIIPIAFFNREYTGTYGTTNTDLGGTSAVMFKIGFNSAKVRFLFGNYSVGTGGESNNAHYITISASFQATADSGTPVALTFGGASSITLNGSQQAWSDWLTVSLTSGQYCQVRCFVQTTGNGQAFPIGPFNVPGNGSVSGYGGSAGNNYFQNGSGNGSNQLLTSGAASLWTSDSSAAMMNAIAIDGYASDGLARPVVALVGDSILQGTADSVLNTATIPDGTGGAAVRAMVQLGIPYYLLARFGESLAAASPFVGYLATQTHNNRLRRVFRSTAIIEEYGANDTSVAVATYKSDKLIFWQILASCGAPVIPVTITPRPTYTTATFPTSNQTPSTNLSWYQSYNAWLRAPASAGAGNSATYDAALVGVTIPYIIDAASYVETNSSNATPGGPSSPITAGYWYCGPSNNTQMTVDCVHPTTAGTALILPAYLGAQSAILATTPMGGSGPFGHPFFVSN